MVNKDRSNVRKSGYIYEYRFAFLGDTCTGKTSALNRFVSDTFTHRHRPTVEDHITHIVDHNGNLLVCLMVDTSGSCDFPAMRRLAITKGNAFLVFYSITNRRSFEVAKRTVDEIKTLKPSSQDVKILVIGNKCDLESEREVSTEEGTDYADSINRENVSSMFFECSAKNNQNIDLLFTGVLNMFIPEEPVDEIIPERSTFTRMSLRKKAKKHRLEKQKAVEKLRQQNNNFFSDSDLTSNRKSYHADEKVHTGQLVRCSSVSSNVGSEGSDDSSGSPPQTRSMSIDQTRTKNIEHGADFQKKQQKSSKDVWKKTFGSVQKLFKNDEIKRTRTLDNTAISSPKYLHKKQTTL